MCLRSWCSCQQYPGSQTPDAMRRAFQAWKLLSGDEGTAA
ncbi:hypothetical protein ALQ54_101687 [Pseudomonas syringae]|nr:hypothetical protein ALQ91_101990 [Pseudomonas syringae pv. syringae]RMN70780.1 hypothetical protein ALQ54_101687 [Pseudomonas syringae]